MSFKFKWFLIISTKVDWDGWGSKGIMYDYMSSMRNLLKVNTGIQYLQMFHLKNPEFINRCVSMDPTKLHYLTPESKRMNIILMDCIHYMVCQGKTFSWQGYFQISSQREHVKNVSIFVRSMCITQSKIVSNYCFKQCSLKYCLQNIVLFEVIYYSSE